MVDFDKARLPYLRELLLKRQIGLQDLAKIAEQSTQTVQLDQTSVGRLSRMDALQGQAMSQEQERRRKFELQRIESALLRIDTNNYGYCLRCDEVIALKRLEFDPSVILCIDCASQSQNP